MPTPPDRFPHLEGCMVHLRPTTAGKGMCFHRSAALCLDLPGSEVCMGIFRAATPEERLAIPDASDVPFIHCWVEYEGGVLAPSTIERAGNQLRMMRREGEGGYYTVNGARDIVRLTRKELIKAARGTGMAAHFLYGHPLMGGRSIGAILLEAGGVPHVLTPEGSVIPPESA